LNVIGGAACRSSCASTLPTSALCSWPKTKIPAMPAIMAMVLRLSAFMHFSPMFL
jgi:hypothetical protein